MFAFQNYYWIINTILIINEENYFNYNSGRGENIIKQY